MPYKNQLDEFNARFVSGALPFKLPTSLNKYKTQATDDGKIDSSVQVENTNKDGAQIISASGSSGKKTTEKQSISNVKTNKNIDINKITNIPKTDKNIDSIEVISDGKQTPTVQKANSTNEKIVDNFGDGTESGLSSGLPEKQAAYKADPDYKDGISKYPTGQNIPNKSKGKITSVPDLPKNINVNQRTLRVDNAALNLVSTEEDVYNSAASNSGRVDPDFDSSGNNTSGKIDLSIKSDVDRTVDYDASLADEVISDSPRVNTSNSGNSRISNDSTVEETVQSKINEYKLNPYYDDGSTSYPNINGVTGDYSDTVRPKIPQPSFSTTTAIEEQLTPRTIVEQEVVYYENSTNSGKVDFENISQYGKFIGGIPDDTSKTTLTSAIKTYDDTTKSDERETVLIKQQASLPDAFSKTNKIEPLPPFLKKDIISYGIDNSTTKTAKEEIFVKNLIPYFGTNIIQQIQNAATSAGTGSGLDKTLNIASAAFGVRSMLAKFSNLDAIEAVKVAGLMPEAFIMQELLSTVTGLGEFSLRGSSIKDPGEISDSLKGLTKIVGKATGISGLGTGIKSVKNLFDEKGKSITQKLEASKGYQNNKTRLDSDIKILGVGGKTDNNKLKTSNNKIVRTDLRTDINSELNEIEDSKNNLELAKERLKRFGDAFSIGYILVVPFKDGLASRIKIPFQTTPNLGNESVSAIYNNETLLHRSSELYNYTSSKRDGYSLTTSYYALAPGASQNYYRNRKINAKDSRNSGKGKSTTYNGGSIDLTNSGNNYQNDYIQHWSMDVIQDIQLAYKALSLPTYPNGTDIQFRRPPFIKIVVGSDSSENEGIKNMLYRNPAADEDRFFKSVEKVTADGQGINMTNNTAWKTVKTFVVSSVVVDKKTGENPYIFDTDGKPLDTMGFDVTLNLLEVSPSYMDLEPDFEANINFAERNSTRDGNSKFVLPTDRFN